ncbi:hypothetical protein MBAV_000663 [Candidatus Magnetobacterium bavaricum]|uniref:Uncharacterized protein n=1 Tax=Candidatus Magnetobacterium bavaricum TaxID=29290 RepID=A0A0F3H2H0_9BACT|nr:hypothetical protein MBAV_000663 [Candidatus Magnetobacterium bavaricum]
MKEKGKRKKGAFCGRGGCDPLRENRASPPPPPFRTPCKGGRAAILSQQGVGKCLWLKVAPAPGTKKPP